ncbi:outer membrane surface hemagglutinin protein [Stenotrophomonas maltophilia AU12-09]|uniref:VENN motif pre-toxin domain-containing protein n=1 Tax=Stenotrophomonas maltophilia TaxID=40324 RepID=UPI0002BD367E|nr:VENN motif pre-toxin domain-containing protein [Stenotrophomonas maltophilia]EMI50853.1 outer membrane surface hemagglutinin protein [Stenotrophomonas maltophilia AU12-09]
MQDIAESMSRNSQVGGRVQVSFGTAWNADGYASAGKASGSYQGVGQQSGLFAGNGGYHVDAGHVNLVGGAIASTHAGNSELTAGSLTFTDLQNHMNYTASSGSISGGAGGKMDGWAPKPGTAAPRGGPGLPMMEKGSDSSSTLATLTEGNITIGGKQTSAAELGINTDASGAHRALDALPDASKLLADQQAMAAAAGTVMATSQQIAWDIGSADAKKITDKYREGMSPEERRAFDALLPDEQLKRLVAFDATYPDALATQQKWAPDGVYGRALGAVISALVGGVEGQGLGQLGSNALAPYAAELIGKTFDPNKQSAVPSEAMQMLSHALLGALLAEANGGKAGTGALAAGGGELAAKFLGDYYAKQNKGQLSPEQAEQVRVLGQAVGAMAGGLSAAGISGATLGMGIAKNSVENNYLNHDERMEYLQATVICSDAGKDCDIKENFERLSAERDYKLLMACQVPGSAACAEQRSLAKIALESHNSPIYKGEYDAWMAENADKLIAASKNAGSGVSLEKIAIHSSTEDLQRKVYCSLVGECGSNTVDLLRGAGYGAEADWLSSTNRAVAGAAFVNGLWTGGRDLVAGAASMNQIGVLLGLVSDYEEMDKLGLQAFSQKRNNAISQAINEYMEKTAGLAYYLAGGRNSWSFEDVDQAANVGGKLTVDIGTSLLGPEAFLAKGAKTTALEAAASEALERARVARSVKLEPDGSLPPHLLPDNIVGDGSIAHLGGVNYPDGISFKVDIDAHISRPDGYSQKNGISGAHNSVEFRSEAAARGVKIVSEVSTDVPGVSVISYQVPALDPTGKVIVGYKNKVQTKTVYDPAIMSDRKVLALGQEAAAKGYKDAVAAGKRIYESNAGGVSFVVYIDDAGVVKNFHPK